MAAILVNKEKEIQGKITVTRGVDIHNDVKKMFVEGLLKTKEYIEEITELETDRLIIEKVIVHQETFGSEEEEIVYNFIAGDLEFKD